jgi:hypothetical protein
MTNRNNRAFYLQLIPALILLLLVSIPLFFLPFGRDQASLFFVSRNLLDGGLPYVEYWDHKGPLLPLIYALVSWGEIAYYKLHLLDFTALAAACVMLSFALRKIIVRPPVAAVVVAFGAMYLTVSFWHLGQAEIFIAVLLAGALLLVADEEQSRPVAAALVLGIAATIKPVSLFHLPVLLIIVAQDARGHGRLKKLLLVAGAFCVAPALFAAVYLLRGHFNKLVECYLAFNLLQAKASPLQLVIGATINATYIFLFPLIFAIIGIVELRRKAGKRARLLLGSFAVASLAGVFVQQRLWLYHWVIVMPFLAVYVGVGLQVCGRVVLDSGRTYKRRTAALLLIFTACGVYSARWVDTSGIRALLPARNELEYYGAFKNESESYDLSRSYEIADYVRYHTDPNDKILLWGFDGNAYRLADRMHATRFFFDLPLTFTPQGKRAFALRAKWRREFIADLKTDPPLLIGIQKNDTNALEKKDSAESAESFIEFSVILRSRYDKTDKVGNTLFYRLRSIGNG